MICNQYICLIINVLSSDAVSNSDFVTSDVLKTVENNWKGYGRKRSRLR
jgi:hypothetical protein